MLSLFSLLFNFLDFHLIFFGSFVSFYVWMCLFYLFALLRLRMGEKGRKLHIFLPSRCLVTLKFLLEIQNCGYYQKNQIGIWHKRFKVICCLLFFLYLYFCPLKLSSLFFIFGINWYRKLTPYFERTNKNELTLIVTKKVIIGFAIIFNAIKEGSMAVAIFRLYWSSSKQELYIKK